MKGLVNLSGLGIGLDYLQTLAMFSAFNFKWPGLVVSLGGSGDLKFLRLARLIILK